MMGTSLKECCKHVKPLRHNQYGMLVLTGSSDFSRFFIKAFTCCMQSSSCISRVVRTLGSCLRLSKRFVLFLLAEDELHAEVALGDARSAPALALRWSGKSPPRRCMAMPTAPGPSFQEKECAEIHGKCPDKTI